jgi:hypothetical protein
MEKKAWPYVAGMLDAEGTIQITVHNRPNGITGLGLQIVITNTDKRIMDWLVKNFGGKFYRRKNNRGFSTLDSPDIYFWHLFGKGNQEAFLLGILPYITAKKQEAVLALEFARMVGWSKERKLEIAEEIKSAKVSDINKDRAQVLPKLTPQEASAFVAGLFDGDGSIGVSIELTQKRLILVRWLLAHYGGRFDERSMNGGKTYFRWRLSGRKNKHDFLLDVIPHLILKKDRAKNLLASLRASEQGSATTEMLSTLPKSKDTV